MIALFGCRTPLITDYVETCRRLGISALGISETGTPRTPHDFPVQDIGSYRAAIARHPFIPCAFSPERRRELWQTAEELGCRPADALIDPTAILPDAIRIGVGSFINAGCVIGAETLLGEAVLINRAANIGHHAIIGSFVSIGPGSTVAGNIRIDSGAVIGAGTTILPHVRIGEAAIVSAGSVVRENVPDHGFVAGNPARQLSYDRTKGTLHVPGEE